jgi:hypothetical protein
MALSATRLARLEARLVLYYAAEEAILRNQSYEMPDGRRLERAQLKSVQTMIADLEQQIDAGSPDAAPRGRARAGVIGGRR